MHYFPANIFSDNYVETKISNTSSIAVKFPDPFANQLLYITDSNRIRNLMKIFIPSDFIPDELNDYINGKGNTTTINKILNYFKSIFSSDV